MPVNDQEIRQAMRRIAERVPDDPAAALGTVERRVSGNTSRGWVWAVVGAAAAALAIVALTTLLGGNHPTRQSPVAPPSHGNPADSVDPFLPTRTLTSQALGLGRVERVAVSPKGYLVVTGQSQQVAEVTESGHVLRTWGRPGTGPGEFRLEDGALAVGPDGKVYVADTNNFRVDVFSADGRYLRSLGGYGHGPGQFVEPTEVAVDGSGDVYVNDDTQMTLTKLNASGEQLWRLGRAATPDPDLRGHWHFTGFETRGNLLAANDDAGKVLWLRPDGTKLAVFGSGASSFRSGGVARGLGEFPHGACGASVGPGRLFFVLSCQDAGQRNHGLEVFDQNRHLLAHPVGTPFATTPVFLPDGTTVLVDYRGNIVEARLRLPRQ